MPRTTKLFTLHVYVTESERRTIEHAAMVADRSISKYVKHAALEKARQEAPNA
jgi:uncharacterized protein (DUF1778 family)